MYLTSCSRVSPLPEVVSGSASQSSSANDISSMSTEQTLASDTDSSSIDTLTGPLDESQWTPGSVHIHIQINHHLLHSVSVHHAFLSPWKNRSIFLFAFFLWSGWSFPTLQTTSWHLAVPSVDSKVNPLLPCGLFWWSILYNEYGFSCYLCSFGMPGF